MQSKRKQRSEDFDVTEFLRPTDTDLKSALTSLLTHQVADDHHSAATVTVQPGTLANTATPSFSTPPNMAPGPNTAPGSLHDSGYNFEPGAGYLPDANKDSVPITEEHEPERSVQHSITDNSAPGSVYDPGYKLEPGPDYLPDANKDSVPITEEHEPERSDRHSTADNSAPGSVYDPGYKLEPGPDYLPDANKDSVPITEEHETERSDQHPTTDNSAPGSVYGPVSLLIPGSLTEPEPTPAQGSRGRFRVRRMKRAQDAHTPTEQLMYEFLWKTAAPKDDASRIITIGLGGIMRALGLSKNGARAALRSLIKKLAVEEQRTYRCEDHTAITYRVLSYQEILRQRKERGMTWYMKRTQAVIFVDPASGLPFGSPGFSPNTASGSDIEPASGISPARESNNAPAPTPRYDHDPGSKYAPLYREAFERNLSRERASSKSSSTSPPPSIELAQGLLQIFPFIDNEAVIILWAECKARVADCTAEEVLYFSHQKAAICRNGKIQNPIGFLLAAVPKCFDGAAFINFRKEQTKLKEAERKSEEEKHEKAGRLAEETRREQESYHRAEERLQALGKLEYDALYTMAEKELKVLVPKLALWTPEARQQNIRSRMIAEIQRRERQQERPVADSAAAK